jgi:hypothetical protein
LLLAFERVGRVASTPIRRGTVRADNTLARHVIQLRGRSGKHLDSRGVARILCQEHRRRRPNWRSIKSGGACESGPHNLVRQGDGRYSCFHDLVARHPQDKREAIRLVGPQQCEARVRHAEADQSAENIRQVGRCERRQEMSSGHHPPEARNLVGGLGRLSGPTEGSGRYSRR